MTIYTPQTYKSDEFLKVKSEGQFKLQTLLDGLTIDTSNDTPVLVVYEVFWPDLDDGPDNSILTTRLEDAVQYARYERDVEGWIRERYVWGM